MCSPIEELYDEEDFSERKAISRWESPRLVWHMTARLAMDDASVSVIVSDTGIEIDSKNCLLSSTLLARRPGAFTCRGRELSSLLKSRKGIMELLLSIAW